MVEVDWYNSTYCPKCGSTNGTLRGDPDNIIITEQGHINLMKYYVICEECKWKGDYKDLLTIEELKRKNRRDKLNKLNNCI